MLRVARWIGDNQKQTSLAIGPLEFLKSARIKHHWSKALHPRIIGTRYHRRTATLKNQHARMPVIVDSKPIAICPSHCIKTHICIRVRLSRRTGLSFMVTYRPNNFLLLQVVAVASGDLVDSRGAEKGVANSIHKNLTLTTHYMSKAGYMWSS